MNDDNIVFKLLNLVPDFFKWRYKILKRNKYCFTYLISFCLIFGIYFISFRLSLNDPVSLYLKKRWYGSILFLIFFIIYLYIFYSKPKMDYLFNMENTFTAYGKATHTPGNINFHEIKNLVERNEINDVFKEIDLKFRNLNKRAVLIVGEPASGKTSIALSIGYKLWNSGFKKQVFYWNLNNNKGRKNIDDSFHLLLNDIQRNHREIILIIEDIHSNIDTFEKSIIPLINSNENLIAILTSRNVGNFESLEKMDESISLNYPTMKFNRRGFLNFGEEKIIEIRSDFKFVNEILKASGLNIDDINYINYNLAKNKSGENFNLIILDVLITITLEAKNKGIFLGESEINRVEIYQFIEYMIETIWKSLKNDTYSKYDYLKIMFILSAFSKHEFPIENSYLKNCIKFSLNDFLILDALVDQCELYPVKSKLNYAYILPHSKYAEIVNETLINRFNVNLNEDDLLFYYCEKGENIYSLLNILMNERLEWGRRMTRDEAKNSTKFAEIIKKDPIKFQRVNLENFNLNEVNQLFDEIEFISPELIVNIIQNNLNNFKNMNFENYDLKDISNFMGFSQRCSEEIKTTILDYYKKYFLGDNFIEEISKNEIDTIGPFIRTLAIHSEETCFSFIEKNEKLLKSKCVSLEV